MQKKEKKRQGKIGWIGGTAHSLSLSGMGID
jgi:hypothetical protein